MELLYYFLPTLFILLIVKLLVQTKKNLPPSPFAIPILGHLHLFKLPLNRTLQALTNQYGPILFLRFGSRPVLVISSQSLAEECFTKNDIIFANRPHTITGDRLSYNYTIFTWSSYGHHWRNMRRITTIEIFSSKSLQMSYAIRKEEIHCLVKNLYQSSNCGLQHFDLKFQFSKLMFNTVMRMVAGKRFFEDFMDLDEQKQVHVHLKAIFAPFMFLNMEDFLPIIKWIGLNGRENNMIKVQKKRDSFLQDMINEYRQKINSSSTSVAEEKNKTTIIGALLSIQEAEPEYYSDEIIKGIILTYHRRKWCFWASWTTDLSVLSYENYFSATRFATNYLALRSLQQKKILLRQMFVCQRYLDTPSAKTVEAMMIVEQVAQEHFWNDVNYVLQILEPLYKCLRLLDGDKKATMPYVHKAFDVVREKISEIPGCGWALDIVNKRWTKQLLHVLHTAAMYLNPEYQYTLNLGFSQPHIDAVTAVTKVLFDDGEKQAKTLH